MTRALWDRLLAETRAAYVAHPDLAAFAAFPDDVTPQPVTAFDPGCGGLYARERDLFTDRYSALCDAFAAAGPHAAWRETYKDTDIGDDFMRRFGCYCLIGSGGAFDSARLWAWVVYMPAGLYYPWHHHPGEEIYLVLAGAAEFRREGLPPAMLRAGDTSFHASGQSHAMETREHPVLCLVAWRNGFDTPPVLTRDVPQPAPRSAG